MKKRAISMMLSLVLLTSTCSAGVFAQEGTSELPGDYSVSEESSVEEQDAEQAVSNEEAETEIETTDENTQEFELPTGGEGIDAWAIPEDIPEEDELDILESFVGAAKDVDAQAVVDYAMRYEGYPYVYATQGPNSFDCSGFVYYVFSHFGIYMSASSSSYWGNPERFGTKITDEEDALPGDLVSWRGHVGIYIGNGEFISALNSNDGVCVRRVTRFWKDGVPNPPHHFIRIKGVTSWLNDVTAPQIQDARIVKVNKNGYTVLCEVTDSESGVQSVQFPTTPAGETAQNRDKDFENQAKFRGNAAGEQYYFQVNTKELDQNADSYQTRIVAVDKRGNESTLLLDPVSLADAQEMPSLLYRTHMQTAGWLEDTADGSVSGITGLSKRMEAVVIQLLDENGNPMDPARGGITYRAHVQTYGWMDWGESGDLVGTTGESKRVEALQLKLTGELAKDYDVYYRAHAQHYGWLGWAKNGQSSGTAGYAYRLEAIQIMLLPKNSDTPGISVNAFYNADGHTHDFVAEYGNDATCTEAGYWYLRCYCQEVEEQNTPALGHDYQATVVKEAQPDGYGVKKYVCSRCGDSYLENYKYTALTPHVTYFTHVQTYGNLDWVQDGALSGTTGESKRLESIQIKLVDENGAAIDPKQLGVTYQTHVQTYGWLDWVSNGAMGGTQGESKRMEAIVLKLTGEQADQYELYYCVHSQTFGWLNWAKTGEQAGTSGMSKRLEALQIVICPKGTPAPKALGTETRSYIPGE